MSVDIGKRLKQAREMHRLTIEDIAAQTRIPQKYLLAIENGQFDLLPSPIYVRSYVRSYANRVGENPQLLLRHYNPSSNASTSRGTTSAYPTVRQELRRDRPAIAPTRNRSSMEESSSRRESSYGYSGSEAVQSQSRYQNREIYESSQNRGEYHTHPTAYQEQWQQRDLSQTMAARSRRVNPSNSTIVQPEPNTYPAQPSARSNINEESSTVLEAEIVSSTPYSQRRRPTMPKDVPDPEELGIEPKTKHREIEMTPLPSRSTSTPSRTQRMRAVTEEDHNKKSGFSWGKLYNWLLIVGAIGLAIAVIVFLWTMYSEPEGSSASSKTPIESKEPDSKGGSSTKQEPILTLISTAPNGVDRWELSNVQQIDLKVDVAVGKESQLEIRDQEVGEPIVSMRLEPGKMFTKSLNKTIWITLSHPVDTTVTLNGKQLPTNGYKKEKSFHINLVN
ncbi:helix-turn-helix domain-containing protein [Hazenella coriacea]|uniref:Helix-turn-helix protein n=1 Tax=Hazenella coriacea TaxID=1179467 RepID=A0A4R3L077_9BACL|nr:helix-turn-helix transcriptional regulator [Hazenella coriacea]TCS92582.1 helix-turn-helix protein [Hazenella coriacea]